MLISRLALLASYALGCRLPSPLSASFVGSDALRTQENPTANGSLTQIHKRFTPVS